MSELARAVSDWIREDALTKAVEDADAKTIAALKLPIVSAIVANFINNAAREDAPLSPVEHFATRLLLPCCRVAAADHRELWEFIDAPAAAATSLTSGRQQRTAPGGPVNDVCRLNLWNEQQALKKAVACLNALSASSSIKDVATGAKSALGWVLDVFSLQLKPLVHHKDDDARQVDDATAHRHNNIPNNLNVYVVPMTYTSRDVVADSGDDGALLGVVAEGSLHCARPVASFSPLLTVPREKMFTRSVLSGRCALYDALSDEAGAWDAFPDDETVLLMCFVFEQFFVGAEHSAWKELLLGCPRCYPSVPTFWTMAELGELEGTTMIDDVLEKKESLVQFQQQLVSAMQSMPSVTQKILDMIAGRQEVAPSLLVQQEGAAAPSIALLEGSLSSWLEALFSEAHLHWARATFDSRAFNLNIDGAVTIALVPFADMINHGTRSDVVKRHVEPDGGPFVLTTGAALSASDVGRELIMSYGPLQSWELIMSYGFILSDSEENDNDRIPLPLAVDEAVAEEDGPVEREYKQRRAALMKRHGLLVGGSSFWIGHKGVPCPALLAILRLQLAEIEHFPALEASQYAVFNVVDVALEQRVVLTLQNIVEVMLEDFSTTVEEDEALLLLTPCSQLDGENEEDDDDDDGDEQVAVVGNARLAVQLRLRMKRMLHAAAQWCNDELEHLSATV